MLEEKNMNQDYILEEEESNKGLENENNGDNLDYELENKSKKKSVKNKFILIELIIILILGAIIYFQFSSFSEKREEVRNSYDSLNQLEWELKDCRELISQNQGEFDRYDYCRELIKSFDN